MTTNERADISLTERLPLPADSVDQLVGSWSARRPDLDFSPWSVLTRLNRVNHHMQADIRELYEAEGVSSANFYLVVVLASFGEEAKVSQARLMEELGLTSGTMSVRIGRMVEEGLVDCQPDPESKRNTVVTLTQRGRELFERVLPAYLATERRLLSALNAEEEQLLVSLLRKLLVEFEGALPTPQVTVGLGLSLAPAHVAVALRQSLGLPAVAALLVRAADDTGAAAKAGVRTGDLLLRSKRRELRSVSDLYAAIEDASKAGRLALTLLRGTSEHQVTVELAEALSVGARPHRPAGKSPSGEHKV